jgi:hypothetical protein
VLSPLAALTAVPTRLATVPVDPDAETARRWAEDELADPIYHDRPSHLELLVGWVLDRLADLEGAAGSIDARTAALVVGVAVLVVAAIVLVVAGPVRRARAARASTDVFGDDTRTAAELRASADRLAGEGLWSLAVLDRFRAVLRSLEERALLDERPGRTAHEAGEEAAGRLPTCAEDLRRASRLFDDVCYGDVAATQDDDAWLREVDRRVGETRPAPVTPAVRPEDAEVGA